MSHDRDTLTRTLRRLAPGAAVLRLRADGTVTAYRANRTIIRGREQAADRRIAQLLRAAFSGVNWRAGHDYHLADGDLRAAPTQGQPGCWPAADRTFGSAASPVLLAPARQPV